MRRVVTFYKFFAIEDPAAMSESLQAACAARQIKGTILVAGEGINGTLVGAKAKLEALTEDLRRLTHQEVAFKWSDLQPDNPGFHRLKVRTKPEIVSFGVADLEVEQTGVHVGAQEWNALLADPQVCVIDTRNTYEIDIGTFPGALNPRTTNFREFPQWADAHLPEDRTQKIAMFCTGGIRCEKASAYLVAQGYESVYQLDGGILKYLETVAEDRNRWSGECFVFDQRVSVDASLQQGRYQQCFACRHPVSAEDMASPEYEQGVSCPHCSNVGEAERAARLRERQKQVDLARQRGEHHIGGPQVTSGAADRC